MDRINQGINALIALFIAGANLVWAWLAIADRWLHGKLTELGVGPPLQTIILIVVTVVLIAAVLRLFGGIIRLLLVVLLFLLALQMVLPVAQP